MFLNSNQEPIKREQDKDLSTISKLLILLIPLLLVAGYFTYSSVSGATTFGRTISTPGLATGLVGHWSFDGSTISGTTVTDVSGNGNNGTLTNGPTPTIGILGQGLLFSGSNYLTVPYSQSVAPTKITVSYWMKQSVTPTSLDTLISRKYNGAGIPFFSDMRGAGSQKPTFGTYTGSDHYVTALSPLTVGNWYHIVGTFDGSSYKIYIDGVLDNTLSDSTPLYISTDTSLGIGYLDLAATPARFFKGTIDDTRIYNRALSANEIFTLYQQGKPDKINSSQNDIPGSTLQTGLVGLWSFNGPDLSGTTAFDRSGQDNHGTMVNSPTPAIGKVGQALSFDGAGAKYVSPSSAPEISSIGSFTYSIWIKPSTFTNGLVNDGYGTYFFDRTTATLGLVSLKAVSGQYAYQSRSDSGTSLQSITTTSGITLNEWSHIVMVRDYGVGYRIYKNGVLEGSTTAGASDSVSPPIFTLGRSVPNDGGDVTGSMDEFRIYNRALSAYEIMDLYNKGVGSNI